MSNASNPNKRASRYMSIPKAPSTAALSLAKAATSDTSIHAYAPLLTASLVSAVAFVNHLLQQPDRRNAEQVVREILRARQFQSQIKDRDAYSLTG